MTDIVDRETRSRVMASVRSRGNRSTEKRLRYALMRAKIRGWRVQARDVPGVPDFIFEKKQLAVFVDGCFWHGCPRCYRRPHSSRKYWDEKVRRNRTRDRRINAKLPRDGWAVLRFWEHSLSNIEKVVSKIRQRVE